MPEYLNSSRQTVQIGRFLYFQKSTRSYQRTFAVITAQVPSTLPSAIEGTKFFREAFYDALEMNT
jgi:hypothetical protein